MRFLSHSLKTSVVLPGANLLNGSRRTKETDGPQLDHLSRLSAWLARIAPGTQTKLRRKLQRDSSFRRLQSRATRASKSHLPSPSPARPLIWRPTNLNAGRAAAVQLKSVQGNNNNERQKLAPELNRSVRMTKRPNTTAQLPGRVRGPARSGKLNTRPCHLGKLKSVLAQLSATAKASKTNRWRRWEASSSNCVVAVRH